MLFQPTFPAFSSLRASLKGFGWGWGGGGQSRRVWVRWSSYFEEADELSADECPGFGFETESHGKHMLPPKQLQCACDCSVGVHRKQYAFAEDTLCEQ